MQEDKLRDRFKVELQTQSQILVRLKKQYLRHRAIADELDRYRDGHGFVEVASPDHFEDIRSAYEKVIIDLASICTGWAPTKPDPKGKRPKGFLEKLTEFRDMFLLKTVDQVPDSPILIAKTDLSPAAMRETERRIQEAHKQAVVESQRNSLAELFPDWDANLGVTRDNIAALQKVFQKEVELLKTIRHDHLAHIHENENLPRRATTPRADFSIVDSTFEKVEAILKHLWSTVFGSRYVFPQYRASNANLQIRDQVDLIRLGTIHKILDATGITQLLQHDPEKPYYENYRQEYGKRLVIQSKKQKAGNGRTDDSQTADGIQP